VAGAGTAGAGANVLPSSAVADGRTRDRVVRLLLENGPTTAAALGERLGLSAAAVRRHLDALVDGGVATAVSTPPTGSRGRPARAFRLTDAGHAGLQTAYDELATSALRFLAVTSGREAVEAFAATRSAELERRLVEELGDVPAGPSWERAPALARALTAQGYAASTSRTPAGSAQLCQHHCPVHTVAAEFPELCDAETTALGRLLGTHVQRLATIAHGDGVCTIHIPAADRPGKVSGVAARSNAGDRMAARSGRPPAAGPQIHDDTAPATQPRRTSP